MKIEIRGVPEFEFKLTEAQVDVLIKLSASHYDMFCRSASDDTTSPPPGFLCRWRNCVRTAGPEYMLGASWQQLDVCLKIMEWTLGCSSTEKELVINLSDAFMRAMDAVRELLPKWRTEVTT